MITVKLFGMIRLETGIKELYLEANTVKQLFQTLCNQSDKLTEKELDGCVILINGNKGSKRSKLHDGDVVTLMSPVAGG